MDLYDDAVILALLYYYLSTGVCKALVLDGGTTLCKLFVDIPREMLVFECGCTDISRAEYEGYFLIKDARYQTALHDIHSFLCAGNSLILVYFFLMLQNTSPKRSQIERARVLTYSEIGL